MYNIVFVSGVVFQLRSLSHFLWPHGLQHARLPYPSSYPRACSNSCPSSRWCHPTIPSSVIPFSSCLQSFPASGYFSMSQRFALGGQSIGASASVLPMNIQGWFPLGLTGFPSLDGLNLIVVDFYQTFPLYLVFYVCIMFKKYFPTLWL